MATLGDIKKNLNMAVQVVQLPTFPYTKAPQFFLKLHGLVTIQC